MSFAADPDCLFCKLIAGDIPADVVHETGATFAFRDVQPQAPTHVLVIPRRHVPDIASLVAAAPTEVEALFAAAAAVAEQEGLTGADAGYRMVANTGPA
ncbi:MAG: HIT domain-containing protein, partial [Nostocoides sp.]